jgi:hypothetical protein
VDGGRLADRVGLFIRPATLVPTMETITDRLEEPTVVRTDLGAIFVSLELIPTASGSDSLGMHKLEEV